MKFNANYILILCCLLTAQVHSQNVLNEPAPEPLSSLIHQVGLQSNFDSTENSLNVYSTSQQATTNQLSLHFPTTNTAFVKKDFIKNPIQKDWLTNNFILTLVIVMLLFTFIAGYIFQRFRAKQQQTIQTITNQLENLKKEKAELINKNELTVNELNHRIKNNLYLLEVMLHSNSQNLEDKNAYLALKKSQNQLRSIGLTHNLLHQTNQIQKVNIKNYLGELAEYLSESLLTDESIFLEGNVENIEVSSKTAISIGLILNEAVTNAVKYAFPNQTNGKITFSLNYNTPKKQINFHIADNGVGLQKHENNGAFNGLSLIKGLTQQINGELKIESNQGTRLDFIFSL